ncbi:hypothetical protein CAY53_09725 [Desulfobulbus oralis]|uniref:Uncharacterized protein n=1 Tax=Desulfobulbus oralis TaxID=1986146 RepID=A0A2L1GPV8_9BACT|nr:hypothetical protein CAY53_09725 [Desulfobulbus oralis]
MFTPPLRKQADRRATIFYALFIGVPCAANASSGDHVRLEKISWLARLPLLATFPKPALWLLSLLRR